MGYALTAKSFSQECGGQCVWVEELYVLPAYQGKGMGSRVFELLNAYYPDCCRFRLEVEPENEGAARLYRRLGYEADKSSYCALLRLESEGASGECVDFGETLADL